MIVVVEVSTHEPPSTAGEILRLALLCLALFAGFLVIGVMIARIFTLDVDRFNRLYFADLAGAATGCAAAVPLMLLKKGYMCRKEIRRLLRSDMAAHRTEMGGSHWMLVSWMSLQTVDRSRVLNISFIRSLSRGK